MPNPIRQHHEDVAARIASGEPGWAQSVIGNTLVSLDATSFPNTVTHGGSAPTSIGDIIEEMMLDLARHEDGAIASNRAFSRNRIEFLIKDKRAWPGSYKKIQKQADDLERLLKERPELFY